MADKKARNGHIARKRRSRATPVPQHTSKTTRRLALISSRPVIHARLAGVMDAGDLRYANERFAALLEQLDQLQDVLLRSSDRRLLQQAKAAAWSTMNTLNELFQARATLVAFMSEDENLGVH